MFCAALLATLALAAQDLKVVVALDNEYSLYLPGQAPISGPKDGEDGIQYGWANVKTYNVALQGSGPWVIGIHGKDYGVISGLFAGVTLNGQPFTATGIASTKFTASIEKPADNWLDPAFDASSWKTGADLAAADCTNPIWGNNDGQFYGRLTAQMPEQPIAASWLPSCASVNTEVYFRLVIPAPPAPTTTDAYVAPTTTNDAYVAPVTTNDAYVAPVTTTDAYVAPAATTGAYNAPAETNAPVPVDVYPTKPVPVDVYEKPADTYAPKPDESAAPETPDYGTDETVLASSASVARSALFGTVGLIALAFTL